MYVTSSFWIRVDDYVRIWKLFALIDFEIVKKGRRNKRIVTAKVPKEQACLRVAR